VAVVSVENRQESEHRGRRIATAAPRLVGAGVKRVARRKAKRQARRLEAKLIAVARRLPVDTVLDRRRRERATGRVVLLVRVALAAGVVLAIYLAWRSRSRRRAEGTAEAGPAPDAFGAAVDATDDGDQTPAPVIREG
jgi:hypothetical protein